MVLEREVHQFGQAIDGFAQREATHHMEGGEVVNMQKLFDELLLP